MEREDEMKLMTVVHGAMIITMDEEQRVFRDGGIVIEQDRIKAIGQSRDILAQFSHLAHHLVDLSGHILLPGLSVCQCYCLFSILNFRIVLNF